MIGVSGAIGENERHRTRAFKPVMNAKLVARMRDHESRTFSRPLACGLFCDDSLNLRTSMAERTRPWADESLFSHELRCLYRVGNGLVKDRFLVPVRFI